MRFKFFDFRINAKRNIHLEIVFLQFNFCIKMKPQDFAKKSNPAKNQVT